MTIAIIKNVVSATSQRLPWDLRFMPHFKDDIGTLHAKQKIWKFRLLRFAWFGRRRISSLVLLLDDGKKAMVHGQKSIDFALLLLEIINSSNI